MVAITNTAGVVVERLAYDPWGKRRFITGAADTLDAITGQTIDRGFTMHEHIDEMGIINMNGRIYDPLIGRFMSADPYIQAPDDLQSHNRYAYVMNNPLNLTDPSGFSWISKAWKKAWKSPIFKAVLGIVVAVVAPYALTWLAPTLFGAGSLATALATGALSGFASTGTLKGALTGAFTAGIMFGVGEIGKAFELADGGIAKIALHAGAGCASSVAGGGSCKTGAMSGALGEFGHNIDVGSSFAAGVTKSAMMGGIGSKLAGGKFADGAITGSFGYLFNFCSHAASCWNQAQEEIGKLFNSLIPKIDATIALGGGASAGGQLLFVGGSKGGGGTLDTNGQACLATTTCGRLGLGGLAAGGAQGTASIKVGTSPSNAGDVTYYFGVGLDLAAGLKGMSHQVLVGTDASINYAGGIPGAGAGAGASAGIDVCRQVVTSCTPPKR